MEDRERERERERGTSEQTSVPPNRSLRHSPSPAKIATHWSHSHAQWRGLSHYRKKGQPCFINPVAPGCWKQVDLIQQADWSGARSPAQWGHRARIVVKKRRLPGHPSFSCSANPREASSDVVQWPMMFLILHAEDKRPCLAQADLQLIIAFL